MLISASVGNRIVHFKVSNIKRCFSVHEGTQTPSRQNISLKLISSYNLDRICKTSRCFRDRLQKYCKPTSPTDQCCICTDTLDPVIKDISFCTECGENFHESCMETWKNYRRTARRKNSPANCPMCRVSWKTDSPLSNLDVETKIDAEAVQIYMDWVYASTFEIPAVILKRTDPFNLILLKLWAVANAFKDALFKLEVTHAVFDKSNALFGVESVDWAFMEQNCCDEIRKLVIDVVLAHHDESCFSDHMGGLPNYFSSSFDGQTEQIGRYNVLR